MWGHMIPKSCQPKFPARITTDVIEMLGNEDLPRLYMVPYPYVRLDWRGCPNILVTNNEAINDRGKFRGMLELI